MVLRIPRNNTIDRASRQFIQAAQTVGEQCIVFQMYHPASDPDQPRCTRCFDPIYQQSGEPETCTSCYGTTFLGGVKNLWRVWAIFTDNDQDEDITKRGVWDPDDRQVQMEPYPDLQAHDYLVRVKTWSEGFVPIEFGDYFRMGTVLEVTLRAGARYGQQSIDKIAQKAPCSVVGVNDVIQKYIIPQEPVPRPSRPVF